MAAIAVAGRLTCSHGAGSGACLDPRVIRKWYRRTFQHKVAGGIDREGMIDPLRVRDDNLSAPARVRTVAVRWFVNCWVYGPCDDEFWRTGVT